MKKPHLFWILIDSARNYQTDGDMRGLPKAVLDFGKEGLYFKNVITSAPSTIQSISSMMTSSPSYLLSRSYNNYRGKLDCFDYFPEMLRENGYATIGAIYFKHGREVMSNMFGHLKKEFYPKGLTHRKEVWTNQDVYALFTEILKKHDWSTPTMTYLHFNVRVDDNVSDTFNNVLQDLRDNGFYDNSVILVNSDHGYPDPSKNYRFEDSLKDGWGHDKLMTNDNILTPLVIKAPSIEPAEIDTAVATIDIVPTLCSLLKVEGSKKFHGVDISNIATINQDRLLRTDNRYVGQSPAYFAYTKGAQKVIVYRESGKEDLREFYNLVDDLYEEKGFSLNDDFQSFHDECLENEKALLDFHEDLLASNWSKELHEISSKDPQNIVMVLPSTELFRGIARSALARVFPASEIFFHDEVEKENQEFDLKVFILESEIPWQRKSLKSKGMKVNARQTIYLDNNGERIPNPVGFNLYWRFFSKRGGIIKNDPIFLWDLASRVFKKRLLKPIK